MGVDVKTFLGSLPTKGKLDAWEAQIFELLAANATYAQVVEFLKQNGVDARRGEISNFVHRQKRRSRLEAIRDGSTGQSSPQEPVSTDPAPSTAADLAQDPNPAALAAPSSASMAGDPHADMPPGISQHTASTPSPVSTPGTLPKFDWQAQRNKKPNW